ncbi:P-II family nitrogen regulator, partial [Halanaerobium sp.]
MKLLQAIIRPEKSSTVLSELKEAGFPAVTK